VDLNEKSGQEAKCRERILLGVNYAFIGVIILFYGMDLFIVHHLYSGFWDTHSFLFTTSFAMAIEFILVTDLSISFTLAIDSVYYSYLWLSLWTRQNW